MCCRAILLKSQGLKSEDVAAQTEMTHISVDDWTKHFEPDWITGLETRPGRGRKPIMDCSDEKAVRKAFGQDRQSVKKAREFWQQVSGKEARVHSWFFICIDARYRRIRKRIKGNSSPHFYAYKIEKLQISKYRQKTDS